MLVAIDGCFFAQKAQGGVPLRCFVESGAEVRVGWLAPVFPSNTWSNGDFDGRQFSFVQSQLAFAGGRLANEEWFVDVQVWCQRIARRYSEVYRCIESVRLTMLVFNRWSVFRFLQDVFARTTTVEGG